MNEVGLISELLHDLKCRHIVQDVEAMTQGHAPAIRAEDTPRPDMSAGGVSAGGGVRVV